MKKNKLTHSLLVSLLILILACTNAFAQSSLKEAYLVGSDSLPIELNLLIESLTINGVDNDKEEQKISETVQAIDSYAQLLSKEDIFIIGKIEIYKTLLKSNESTVKASVDGDSIALFKKAVLKCRDPFVKWFLKSLLEDCQKLLNLPAYKDYILKKEVGGSKEAQLKKIEQKVRILYRWINKLNPETSEFEENFKNYLRPTMLEALQNIKAAIALMAQTKTNPLPPIQSDLKALKFFSLKTRARPSPTILKAKTVEDILTPLTEERPSGEPNLPKPSSERWDSEENSPSTLKNLPKASDDADWLEDF